MRIERKMKGKEKKELPKAVIPAKVTVIFIDGLRERRT